MLQAPRPAAIETPQPSQPRTSPPQTRRSDRFHGFSIPGPAHHAPGHRARGHPRVGSSASGDLRRGRASRTSPVLSSRPHVVVARRRLLHGLRLAARANCRTRPLLLTRHGHLASTNERRGMARNSSAEVFSVEGWVGGLAQGEGWAAHGSVSESSDGSPEPHCHRAIVERFDDSESCSR